MIRTKQVYNICLILLAISMIFTNVVKAKETLETEQNVQIPAETSEAEQNVPEVTETAEKEAKVDEQTQKENKATKLNSIVITATRTKEKQKDVPSNMEVITSKEIEAAGIKTLGDIIGEKVTGHYHRYTGFSQPAGLTGNLSADTMGNDTSNRILVLVDGHRLGTGNMGKIPPEIIDRIEVIKGSASALYGSAAMGGVINIITKKGTGEINNTVNLEAGSFDYSRTAVTSGGEINNSASYFISGSYMKSGDYYTKKYGTAYNTEASMAQVWGNLTLFPSYNQTLRAGFSYADITHHYPDLVGNSYYDETVKDYSDLSRGHGDLEYNLSILDNKLNWKAMAYYLWDKRSWYTGTSATVEDNANIYNNYTMGTDQQIEIDFIPLNKIILGYTFEMLKGDSKNLSGGTVTADTVPDFKYYTNSAYCQDSVSLFSNSLILILGARYDRFDLKLDESGANNKNFSFDNVSPRGGLVYKILDVLRIRGNAGKSFRAPNADEFGGYYDYGAWGTWEGSLIAGQDLKPEKSTTYDAGFDIYPDNLTFGATYSLVKTKDFITYEYNGTNSSGGPLYVSSNVNKAKMEIIDCYINWEAGKTFGLPVGLNLISNFTYNKKYEDETTGEDLPFIADREIKSNIETVFRALSVTLSHVYVGHEKLSSGGKKNSLYFFNLTSKYNINSMLSVQIGVFNLTNENYEWVKDYPAPERNYKMGLTGKF